MYSVIYIPNFGLQAALRTEPGLRSKPVVLVDGDEAGALVCNMTRAAEREGVFLGLTVPQAMARCPEVLVRYRSEKGEAMVDRTLFDCAYSISPRVEMTLPGISTIGLQGVNAKTLEERLEGIVSELRGLDVVARIGVGSTPFLAMLAAKQAARVLWVEPGTTITSLRQSLVSCESGQMVREAQADYGGAAMGQSSLSLGEFLAQLLIGASEASDRVLEVLGQWGVGTVGAFAALAREQVGERLGREGMELWDKVSGNEERVLKIAELPEVFEESLEFEYEVDSLERLLFLAKRFLDQLCLRLRVRHKVAAEVALRFPLSDIRLEDGERHESYQARLKVPESTADAEILFRMLSTHLEGMELDSPVIGIELKVEPVARNDRQLGLFETSLKNPGRFAETLARIAGLVGPERVGSPRLLADGRPDGFSMEELDAEIGEMDQRVSFEHFGLALRRFRPPLEAEVLMRERRPKWFRCEGIQGYVKDCRGPWADSGYWWEAKLRWNRIEWDVELEQGGLYRLVWEKRWRVEGSYD